MPPNWTETTPFGVADLEPDAATRYSPRAGVPLVRGDTVRCCVAGCTHWLPRRTRGVARQAVCPKHGVSVSTSPTYVYDDFRRNFIVSVPLLERVKQLKVESWRLGNERSEDALSWNLFVSLAELGGLRSAFRLLTGHEADSEPELYPWGVRVTTGEPRQWDRLLAIREELERGAGFPTEPDIVLRVPGVAIVLIEAKFGSPNGTLKGQEERFGSVVEFLDRYPGIDGGPDPLDRDWIEAQPTDAVYQQLVRNVVFAQWLAGPHERAWVVNLVRDTEEREIEQRMACHLHAERPVQFRRRTWEALAGLPVVGDERAVMLKKYLENKTLGLKKAFSL